MTTIRIDAPCPMDWEAMSGDDRRRFCTQCGQHVYDLSVLTRDEAMRVAETGRCVQVRIRPDGSVRFRRPTRSRRARLRAAIAGTIAFGLGLAPASAMGAGTRDLGSSASPGPLERLIDWLKPPAADSGTEPTPALELDESLSIRGAMMLVPPPEMRTRPLTVLGTDETVRLEVSCPDSDYRTQVPIAPGGRSVHVPDKEPCTLRVGDQSFDATAGQLCSSVDGTWVCY